MAAVANLPVLERKNLPAVDTLYAMSEDVLQLATKLGADACELHLSASIAITIQVRNGEPESIEFQCDRDLSVTTYMQHAEGQSSGHAQTGDLTPQAIENAVRAACGFARHTGSDPHAGLAPAERMAVMSADKLQALELYHPWALSLDEAIGRARRCEQAALESDKRITNTEGASIDSHEGISLYANSHGFVGHHQGTRHSISCSVIAQDEQGMQRDYWYSAHRKPGELNSAEVVGQESARRALARLGSRGLSTRTCPVLYSPQMARSLLSGFVAAISGGALYRKASFLLDQAGHSVFSPIINIRQNPHQVSASGSALFDREGVATATRDLVSKGLLQGYVLDAYAARHLGLESTGNAGGVFNLEIEPTGGDCQSLLTEMGTGLLVTEMMGQGANRVTGDYSRGAAGFWVEGGEIAYPVENITVAGNLKNMYKNIRAVGNDVDTRGNIRSGSILIDDLTVAGQ